jgi:RsiW-degrading membrane proteinase PrsW (M82 family)
MKLRLTVTKGSLSGNTIELDQGIVTLGRSAESTLRFDHRFDPGVSTNHAFIESTPRGFLLTDKNSTNGTFVNNNPINEVLLNAGDLIRLGRQGPEMTVDLEVAYPREEITTPGSVPTTLSDGNRVSDTLARMSFYNPQRIEQVRSEEKKPDKSYLGMIVGLAIGGITALIVVILMFANLGFKGTLIGGIMAFIPAPFYLMLFLWIDRYDPEPAWALATAFSWGALFSILVSFVVNTFFGSVAAALIGGPQGDVLSAVISAPLIEEGTKGLGVLMFLIFLRKEFDGVVDGLVYAGIVALGFATVENVLYYGRTYVNEGSGGLLMIGFMRGILSPFAHSLFTSMTGIGCGIARETQNPTLKIIAPVAGYAGAVFLHALWNGIAHALGQMFLLAYFIIWVPLFLMFLGTIIFIARRERRIVKEMLAFEVSNGTLSSEELDMVGSIITRLRWIAESMNDRPKWQARRRYLRAVTKLGFCYWHVARANAANNQTISLPQIPIFKAEITDLKMRI